MDRLNLNSLQIAAIEGALTRDAQKTRDTLAECGDSLAPGYVENLARGAETCERVAEFLQALSSVTIEGE